MLITVTALSDVFSQSNEELGKINFNPGPDSTLIPLDSIFITPDSVKQEDSSIISSPSKIDTILSPDAIESRVDYEATDSMRIDMVTEKVFLYGAAQVNYENIQLNADYIELDLKNNTVFADGRPDSTGRVAGISGVHKPREISVASWSLLRRPTLTASGDRTV